MADAADVPGTAPVPQRPADSGGQPRLGVVGAGPVGLALALRAARLLPQWDITIFDARAADHPVDTDPRTLALALGSLDLLRTMDAWPVAPAQPILGVHVSQQVPGLCAALLGAGQAAVRIRASEQGVPMLGAVLTYGTLVQRLQIAWAERCRSEPHRLHSQFGERVCEVRSLGEVAQIDAGIAWACDLAVVAEGGVFADQPSLAFPDGLRHEYGQTAWVGTVALSRAHEGVAYERFTRAGPAALLPLPPTAQAPHRAALVWCVDARDDPVRDLSPAARLALLSSLFPPEVGALTAVSPLKDFALGLRARTSMVSGRCVYIGNAAQTLHPVAGQGLNLGLRDAFELVHALSRHPGQVPQALRRLALRRAPDRWSMITATDFLARSFTWPWPGLADVRGIALGALDALGPVKTRLARRMMYGWR